MPQSSSLEIAVEALQQRNHVQQKCCPHTWQKWLPPSPRLVARPHKGAGAGAANASRAGGPRHHRCLQGRGNGGHRGFLTQPERGSSEAWHATVVLLGRVLAAPRRRSLRRCTRQRCRRGLRCLTPGLPVLLAEQIVV